LKERISRINVLSASIPGLTSKFWQRIIDDLYLAGGALLRDLPFSLGQHQ
jgi:hypothetical protein